MSDEPRGTIDVAVEDLGESGCVARVTVNRPAKINVLDSAMIAMLTSAFESLSSHERLRIAVLAGAGDRAFIGGADIQAMVELTDPVAAKGFITALHHGCRSIRDLPVQVIAEIRATAWARGSRLRRRAIFASANRGDVRDA